MTMEAQVAVMLNRFRPFKLGGTAETVATKIEILEEVYERLVKQMVDHARYEVITYICTEMCAIRALKRDEMSIQEYERYCEHVKALIAEINDCIKATMKYHQPSLSDSTISYVSENYGLHGAFLYSNDDAGNKLGEMSLAVDLAPSSWTVMKLVIADMIGEDCVASEVPRVINNFRTAFIRQIIEHNT
jgi:hypothetical protein